MQDAWSLVRAWYTILQIQTKSGKANLHDASSYEAFKIFEGSFSWEIKVLKFQEGVKCLLGAKVD